MTRRAHALAAAVTVSLLVLSGATGARATATADLAANGMRAGAAVLPAAEQPPIPEDHQPPSGDPQADQDPDDAMAPQPGLTLARSLPGDRVTCTVDPRDSHDGPSPFHPPRSPA